VALWEANVIRAVIVPFCRRCLRMLITRRAHIGSGERLLRALLLLPPFGFVLVVLRLRLLVAGPLTVDGRTDDGVLLRCRLPDLIQMYVHLFGSWEPDLAAFLRRRLRPGDLFVDVGANVGCMTALAAKVVGTGGAVVAIEASPNVLDELRETVARNRLTNVRLVGAAASDRHEELTLFAGPTHNVGLTATVEHRGLQAAGRVQAAPFGELVTADERTRARLVKIDVEGAEDRVLAGMLPVLDSLHDAELAVELSPTWWQDTKLRPIDVLQPFLDRGYHVYLLPNSYWPWRYLWPNDVGAPRRLRDLSQLEHRVPRLDVVLSRLDRDEL
jgi:FkbM family methyltransferase